VGGTTLCGASCRDLQRDDASCGACGAACGSGQRCTAGLCCAEGWVNCGGTCLDPSNFDASNCGACGNVCGGAAPSCVFGTCTALYWASGPQTNVPVAALTDWHLCFSDKYGESAPLSTVLSACTRSKLALACRPVGSTTLTLVAMAARADVLFDTGFSNVLHVANGVGWYYSSAYSWGFADASESVNRVSCDLNTADGAHRLCFQTNGGIMVGGFRCGTTMGLSDMTWERVIFDAP
jgi:hypothetical protein